MTSSPHSTHARARVGPLVAHHDPAGPHHLTVVPTMLESGTAINIVPEAGQLICDLRADSSDAIKAISLRTRLRQ